MTPADVIVIGAGIVGAACAHELAAAGLSVHVIDARKGGATNAGMGHLVVMDDNPAELAISQASLTQWHAWAPRMAAEAPSTAFTHCGTLWVAADAQEMQEAEHKGYFALARGGMRIADNVVTSFTEDDARKLGDSVQPALNLVKDLAQPEVIGLLGNIVSDAKREVAKPVGNVSLPGLLGQMRDPQVRRGLALTLRLLRVIGARAAVG